jgi:hypothetical protein
VLAGIAGAAAAFLIINKETGSLQLYCNDVEIRHVLIGNPTEGGSGIRANIAGNIMARHMTKTSASPSRGVLKVKGQCIMKPS